MSVTACLCFTTWAAYACDATEPSSEWALDRTRLQVFGFTRCFMCVVFLEEKKMLQWRHRLRYVSAILSSSNIVALLSFCFLTITRFTDYFQTQVLSTGSLHAPCVYSGLASLLNWCLRRWSSYEKLVKFSRQWSGVLIYLPAWQCHCVSSNFQLEHKRH